MHVFVCSERIFVYFNPEARSVGSELQVAVLWQKGIDEPIVPSGIVSFGFGPEELATITTVTEQTKFACILSRKNLL